MLFEISDLNLDFLRNKKKKKAFLLCMDLSMIVFAGYLIVVIYTSDVAYLILLFKSCFLFVD